MQVAIFGGGCFWCTEAVFRAVQGVLDVTSGYAGGLTLDPNYVAVCSGETGHAEVIKIDFDPDLVDFETLLKVFFATHNPTQYNRQGNDIGTQYRSVIFYTTLQQRDEAVSYLQMLASEGIHAVTEVLPAPTFYPAESEHQDFFTKNPTQGYCQVMIPPKLMKLDKLFK